MDRNTQIAILILEILEEAITDQAILEVIESSNITELGITSLNMVMLLIELENTYGCRIDISKITPQDVYTVSGLCKLTEACKS